MKKNLPTKKQALKLAEDYGFLQVRTLMNHEHPNCDDKAYTYFYDGFIACLELCKKATKGLQTKEDVIAILHKYLDDNSCQNEAFHKILEEQLNKWIERNL